MKILEIHHDDLFLFVDADSAYQYLRQAMYQVKRLQKGLPVKNLRTGLDLSKMSKPKVGQ